MWWILILVAVVGGLLLFEVKAKNKLAQQGKIVLRNRGFHKNAEVFTMGMPVEPEQVTEGLKAINAQLKVGIKGSTEKQSFQIEGGSFSKWTESTSFLMMTLSKRSRKKLMTRKQARAACARSWKN